MSARETETRPLPAEQQAAGPARTASVAMLGAGQLARMTLQAAVSLDIDLNVLAAHAGQPAARAGAPWLEGEPGDGEAALTVAAGASIVTFDHELVPAEVLDALEASGATLRPGRVALSLACDKLHARREFDVLGFPQPRFAEVRTGAEAAVFAAEVGWPIVFKRPEGGYDGRGVTVVANDAEAEALTAAGGAWLAEEFVDVETELSVIVARNSNGFARCYPVIETRQEDGICREAVMPAAIPEPLAAEAEALAMSLVAGIDATGVTAVEMLVAEDGRLLICEIAARPHNSGHATIEACVTSQFENHLRGVLDWPIGSTEMRAPAAAMVNILGSADGLTPERLPAALAVEGASVHLYGKTELPGRKIGHVTATGSDPDEAIARARACAHALGGS